MTRLISRREWGAAPARNKTTVAGSARQELTVHNDGGVPIRYAAGSCEAVCFPKIRGTQRFHQQTRGWADIGYNFWICNAHGNVFEGRGWDILGAHANTGNRSGIGVQVHIGGGQGPSPAALAALGWLHDQACRRYGRTLRIGKHNDWMSTTCPGPALVRWVQANRRRQPGQSAPTGAGGGTTTTTGVMGMSKETKTAYRKDQGVESTGKEVELRVTEQGNWGFHSKPGPYVASVSGYAVVEGENVQAILVQDNDRAKSRQWLQRANLAAGINGFGLSCGGVLGDGDTLRVVVVNHSGKPAVVSTVQTVVLS